MEMERYKYIVGGEAHPFIDEYVSSISFDKVLVKYIAMVMLSHVKELVRKGLMPAGSGKAIIGELVKIIEDGGKSLYSWIESSGERYEDAFEALELYLYNVVGPDAGRIAIGRSRNDHIATVLRLAARDLVVELLSILLDIRGILLEKSSRYRDTLFPFFTHAQLAQCGSGAVYFLSYEQVFADLTEIVLHTLRFLDQNPLGSGASAGTILDIDFLRLSSELCLSPKPLPPYYSTGSRLFLLYVASVLAMIMAEVGRFVEDVMLLSNVIPNGLAIPKEHISTSSIMPHKRNLVTLEIARAKVAKVLGLLMSLLSSYKSVPYGYNLDFQEMNTSFFNMFNDTRATLIVIKDLIQGLEIDREEVFKYISDKPCWSSDVVEYVAVKEGKPVREVYIELAKALQDLMSGNGKRLIEFLEKHGLKPEDVWNVVKLKPAVKNLDEMILYAKKRLEEDSAKIQQIRLSLDQCNKTLISSLLQV